MGLMRNLGTLEIVFVFLLSVFLCLLEVNLPYDPVCPYIGKSVGWSVRRSVIVS